MGRELLSAFAQHRALTALLIVLVALLIFVSIKAARAVRAHNAERDKILAKLKKDAALREKYASVTRDQAQTADCRDLLHSVALNILGHCRSNDFGADYTERVSLCGGELFYSDVVFEVLFSSVVQFFNYLVLNSIVVLVDAKFGGNLYLVRGSVGFNLGSIGELFGKNAHWACVTYHRAKTKIREMIGGTEK